MCSCLHIQQAWLRKEVTGAVFQALYNLQHPSNCSAAKQLYCQLGKNCGFGCQLHHVVHCFTIAVALNRTMVVNVSKVLPPAAAAAAAEKVYWPLQQWWSCSGASVKLPPLLVADQPDQADHHDDECYWLMISTELPAACGDNLATADLRNLLTMIADE
jgi:hypothetical protein